MPWYCICDHFNSIGDPSNCEKCGKEKTEKIFPRWQRATRSAEGDFRKYEEPSVGSKSSYGRRKGKPWLKGGD